VLRGALRPKRPARWCWPRKAAATQRGRAGNGASIPSMATTNYAHSYPFFATSVGSTWPGVAALGANRGAGPRPVLLGGPRSWVPGANDQRPSGERLCSDLARRCYGPQSGFAYEDPPEPPDNQRTPSSARFTHRTRGVPACGLSAVDLAFVAAGRRRWLNWERGLRAWTTSAAGVGAR